MLPDRTICFKAVAEHKVGGSKAAAAGKEAVLPQLSFSQQQRTK